MFFNWIAYHTRVLEQNRIYLHQDPPAYLTLFQAEQIESAWIPEENAIRLPMQLSVSGLVLNRMTGIYIEVIPLSNETIELNIDCTQPQLFEWLDRFVKEDMSIRWPEIREYLDKNPWHLHQETTEDNEPYEENIPPWEHIPEANNNRKIVELLWKGKSDHEIAQELRRMGKECVAHTISNRLSNLRAVDAYAPYVPKREDIPAQSGKPWE
jgi:hypothetical protein